MRLRTAGGSAESRPFASRRQRRRPRCGDALVTGERPLTRGSSEWVWSVPVRWGTGSRRSSPRPVSTSLMQDVEQSFPGPGSGHHRQEPEADGGQGARLEELPTPRRLVSRIRATHGARRDRRTSISSSRRSMKTCRPKSTLFGHLDRDDRGGVSSWPATPRRSPLPSSPPPPLARIGSSACTS